jgi:hypothetical protein
VRVLLISSPLQIPFPALTFTGEYVFSDEMVSAFRYYRKNIEEWNLNTEEVLRNLERFNTLE